MTKPLADVTTTHLSKFGLEQIDSAEFERLRSIYVDVTRDYIYAEALHMLRGDRYPCIYAIAPYSGRPTKIGMTSRPAERLRQIQSGNPEFLAIWGVRWLTTMSGNGYIERDAHKLAAGKGRELFGEWFDIDASEALALIETAFVMDGEPICRRMPTVHGIPCPEESGMSLVELAKIQLKNREAMKRARAQEAIERNIRAYAENPLIPQDMVPEAYRLTRCGERGNFDE